MNTDIDFINIAEGDKEFVLIKETFYLIKVGQLYVCGVDGKHLTSRFGMKTSNVEVNEVYLTPNLNEA